MTNLFHRGQYERNVPLSLNQNINDPDGLPQIFSQNNGYLLKPRLHDASNTSNVGHWKHSTHRVADVRMTNGQFPTLALEGNRPSVGFFVALQRVPNVGSKRVQTFVARLHDATYCNESQGVPAVIRGSVFLIKNNKVRSVCRFDKKTYYFSLNIRRIHVENC